MSRIIAQIKKIIQIQGLFILILTAGLILRYQILQIPLSVDEGYWGYTATMLLKGQKLFTDIWSTNPLFTYLPYILSEKILGYGYLNLRITGILINLLTVAVIFLLTKKTFGKWAGYASFLFSTIYSISFQQEGHFILNGEQMSQLPLFSSLLFLVYGFEAKEKTRTLLFALSGILMGYVWQIREHYLLLHIFMFIYLLYGLIKKKIGRKDVLYYLFGSVIPLLMIAVYLLINVNFIDYIKDIYYYRYLYMQSAQSVVFDSRFFYIVNDRMGHLLWILFLAIPAPVFLRKEKNVYQKSWMILVFISGLLILITTGSRLFNHYFLYLTYGTVIISAYGLVRFINYIKINYPILTLPVLAVVCFFSYRQFDLNYQYLMQFNQPKLGLPYKNLIINKEMLDYVSKNYISGRILFLGESIPNYYYLNRDMKEKYPGPGFFIYEPYRTLLWKDWFDKFKKNPPELIVEDFGIEDTLVIAEFKDYVNVNYILDRKINQHYIFKNIGVRP